MLAAGKLREIIGLPRTGQAWTALLVGKHSRGEGVSDKLNGISLVSLD